MGVLQKQRYRKVRNVVCLFSWVKGFRTLYFGLVRFQCLSLKGPYEAV